MGRRPEELFATFLAHAPDKIEIWLGVSRARRATALYGAGRGKPRRPPPSPLRGLGPSGWRSL